MNNYERFAGFALVTLIFSLFPICSILLLSSLLPSIEWRDDHVYRNGDDYLIVEKRGGFVTTDPVYRVLRARSPYGPVRIIEDLNFLNKDEAGFEGNQVIYRGKM